MVRVYALYRVSTVGQVDHDDIPMQRIECQNFVDRQEDWKITEEFYEKRISGYKVSSEKRDAIMQIKEAALAGKFDVLLVFMFDRLGRRDDETPFVVQWFATHGIRVWSVKEGEQRFDNHVDKLLNYIRFWQASGESEKTSIRVRTRQQQMVLAGEYRGGLIPFGFDAVNLGRVNKKGKPVRDLVRNEEEAAIKAQIYHMIVDEGYGGNRIANWLNERGIKTKRGTTLWRATSVRAMIGNPIDRGQMHLGETLSEPIDELRIIDDYYYYKAIEIIEERGKYNAERRRSPARINVGGLLTGIIYCGECSQRLSINHTHKVVETVSGPRDYLRNVYRCYRKLNARVTCEGQSTYNAERIEETVLSVVRSFFARISRVPEAAQVKAAMRREESTQAKALADAAAAVDKAAKAVAALEDQAIKALTGESQLDLGIINQLMPKQKAALEAAREEYQRILLVNQAEEETLEAKRLQARKMAEWGQLFEDAPEAQKRMILAEIIDRIEVWRGYQVTIRFKLTARQFLEPDALDAGDQKAS